MEILYEDNHIIAINKRVAEIVQVDKTKDKSLEVTIKEYLKLKYNKPGEAYLGVVHRIDRPVSGVIGIRSLFTKSCAPLLRRRAWGIMDCRNRKVALDFLRQSTTIWLWINWVQHLLLCLIQPGGA